MSDCLFCKMVAGQVPCNKVYEDEQILAFYDLYPKAPVHILVIPKIHIASLFAVDDSNAGVIGYLTKKLGTIASEAGLGHGFKTQIHTGQAAGQEIFHLHYHLMGTKENQ